MIELGNNRNAIYKTLFDARGKLRAALAAKGYLEGATRVNGVGLEAFLRTDPRDVGCDEAMELLHVYAELVADDPGVAERRYPGVAAHLRACGPCAKDLVGLARVITKR